MTVSTYLCRVAGESPDRVGRLHASSQDRLKALALAVHIPVLVWAGSGYLVSSQLFELNTSVSCLVGGIGALLIYLVERLVIASPRRWYVSAGRVLISVIAAVLGASAVDITVFQREVAHELRLDRQRSVATHFEGITSGLAILVDKRKTEWLEAQRAASCEADGTCGSRIRNTGPVYRQLQHHADVLRQDYTKAAARLESSAQARDRELESVQKDDEFLRSAGLLARIDALHRYTIDNRAAFVGWLLLFGLVLCFELLVVGIKLGFGETVDDRIERIREEVSDHKAREYAEAVTSRFAHVRAFIGV